MFDKFILDELISYNSKLACVLDEMRNHHRNANYEHSHRELIFQDNKLKLYHYLSPTPNNNTVLTPVLIIYALVNRPTILDLQKNHSAIATMLEYGLDVYLVDWGYPDNSDTQRGLEDYVNRQLHHCVEAVCNSCSMDSINLLGVCQGGTLSLCYSALHPERVKNLVLMVTPVDFQTKNDKLSHWVKHIDIDLMVNTLGNIPGNMLSNTFLSLKPYQLHLQKYLDLIESIEQFEDIQERISNFIAMEEWIFNGPDLAGEMFREFTTSCYQQNQLVQGKLEIGGQCVDLTTLSIPILNIYANQDHIVPPEASRVLCQLVKTSDYHEMPVPGGHIGLFVRKKSLEHIFPAISNWLQKRN